MNTKIVMALLAVALVFVSIQLVQAKSSHVELSGGDDDAYQNIVTRTSVRAYTDAPVESEKIEKLLRAGMAAPSAVNKQPWHFIVVTDKAVLSRIPEVNPNAGMAAKAPLAIVVCGDLTKALQDRGRDYWVQDASAASENILLAAHALGLGAVWTGTYPSKDRVEGMTRLLKLPETIVPLNTIVIGYPKTSPAPKDKWNPANISYNVFGGKEAPQTTAGKPAAEHKELKPFDVLEEFKENPFSWFKREGLLLAVGSKKGSNAMTIGWGALGNIWNHDNATITVYVAEGRHTHQFMEKAQYFTVMAFDEDHKDILNYMGSHSGRDGDKAKALGLHTKFTANGTPYYEEASEVYECKILYHGPFDPKGFGDVPKKFYANFSAGVHSEYIGEIVGAWRK